MEARDETSRLDNLGHSAVACAPFFQATRGKTMNRPARKLNHLKEKIERRSSRAHKKPGKRTRRMQKWVELYAPRAE